MRSAIVVGSKINTFTGSQSQRLDTCVLGWPARPVSSTLALVQRTPCQAVSPGADMP